jgi:translation initiation factor IF-3
MSIDPEDFRINWKIKAFQVRVVAEDKQLGVMNTDRARRIAEEAGLDLVEVAPEAKPPVCKIINYGRFKYEQQLKKKEQAKKQKESKIQIKEIRLRPTIADNDVAVKISKAKGFLEDKMKVQFNLMFKGQRELIHKEKGFTVINHIISSLSEISLLDRPPKLDGNKIICCLSPKVSS